MLFRSGGYPVAYEKGKPITGLVDGQLPDEPDVTVYHSGTAIAEDGQLVTNGGRVLGVTATAPGLPRAIAIAYEAAEHIHFDKLHKDVYKRQSLDSQISCSCAISSLSPRHSKT